MQYIHKPYKCIMLYTFHTYNIISLLHVNLLSSLNVVHVSINRVDKPCIMVQLLGILDKRMDR